MDNTDKEPSQTQINLCKREILIQYGYIPEDSICIAALTEYFALPPTNLISVWDGIKKKHFEKN